MDLKQHPLADFWRDAGTDALVLTLKETWRLQQQWREVFCLSYFQRSAQWPSFEWIDEWPSVFERPYEPNLLQRAQAIDAYARLDAHQQYVVFSTLHHGHAVACTGQLPPVEYVRRSAWYNERGERLGGPFILAEQQWVWTVVFYFDEGGPFFAWRDVTGEAS